MVYSYNYFESSSTMPSSFGSLFEGFDVSGNTVSKDKVKDKIKSNMEKNINNQTTTTTSSAATTNTETFKGREGFNMTDRELNILRGKQSNSIPINNDLKGESDDVSPSDKSVFENEYSSF